MINNLYIKTKMNQKLGSIFVPKKDTLKREKQMQDELQEKYDKMIKDLNDLKNRYELKIMENNKKFEDEKKVLINEKDI